MSAATASETLARLALSEQRAASNHARLNGMLSPDYVRGRVEGLLSGSLHARFLDWHESPAYSAACNEIDFLRRREAEALFGDQP